MSGARWITKSTYLNFQCNISELHNESSDRVKEGKIIIQTNDLQNFSMGLLISH